MKKKLLSIIIVFTCTIFTSLGQVLLKSGAARLSGLSLLSIATNYALLAGCILYGISAILFILSLRYGELSLVYPIISLSFIWVAILSYFTLGEAVTPEKILGIGFILFGVTAIGRSK